VEEKGIYSIEKFLVARRLMYWQVYLHKTVLGAEKTLVKIIQRAKELIKQGKEVQAASPVFDLFLKGATGTAFIEQQLDKFCQLDDFDVLATIKNWIFHPDTVLSTLCRCLIERRLLKVKLQATPFDQEWIKTLRNNICQQLKINDADCGYLIFAGEAENTTYNPTEERINILFKNGTVTDISKVDNALIHQALASPVKKYYICYYNC
jgi:HD superfamily phosphohydrolase